MYFTEFFDQNYLWKETANILDFLQKNHNNRVFHTWEWGKSLQTSPKFAHSFHLEKSPLPPIGIGSLLNFYSPTKG